MLTIDQIMESLRQTITSQRDAGDVHALRDTQLVAGVLMEAAKVAGDNDTARQFQALAAQAANEQEHIEDK